SGSPSRRSRSSSSAAAPAEPVRGRRSSPRPDRRFAETTAPRSSRATAAVHCRPRPARSRPRGEGTILEEVRFGWLDGGARVRSDAPAFVAIVGRLWGVAPASDSPLRDYEIALAGAGRRTFRGPAGETPLDGRHPAWHAYNLLMRDLL